MTVGLGYVSRNRLHGRRGPLVVVHQLSHCGSGTSYLGLPHNGVAVGGGIGKLQVVVERLTLPPDARGQRSYRCARDESGGVVGHASHALGIVVEQLLHGGWHIAGIKCARVAIAQDGGHLVVARDYHIALISLDVEHIVGALLGGRQPKMQGHWLYFFASHKS